jgi:WD40-like Beta Propeller Repeat
MRTFIAAFLLLVPSAGFGQESPILIGPAINFLPPAVNSTGSVVVFGSTVTLQGVVQTTTDLYVAGKDLVTNVSSAGIANDGSRAFFTSVETKGESVGIVDIASGTTRRLNTDTQGCIQPLVVCPACFFSCVVTPHATPDGSRILYAVRRAQPFYTVTTDGTTVTQLPVYTGSLAPSPQRVISGNRLVVFTSSAPFGPTFAASATDVYSMNLDGSNIRNLTNFGTNSSIFSSNATISADGNTIAFQTNYASSNLPVSPATQIWAVQADGNQLRQLTFGPAAATTPSISADGHAGVFLQAGAIYTVLPLSAPPPSGRRVPIISFNYSTAQAPVISDDGKRVTFLIGPSEFTAGAVYQANIDGSGLHAIYAPRAISPRGVVAAAGFLVPPSPGSLVSVYGINFTGDSITGAAGFPLPPTLGGASVLADAKALPMLSVSPWQINFELPQETPVKSANFQASFDNGIVTPAEIVTVETTGPAVFVSGAQQAAVLHGALRF